MTDELSQLFRRAQDVPLPGPVVEGHVRELRAFAASMHPGRLLRRRGISTRRRRTLIVTASVAAVALAGVGTAAAAGVFSPAPPPDTSTAFCYAAVDSSTSESNRVQFAVADPAGGVGNAARQGLDICAAYWRAGVLRAGQAVDSQQVAGLTGGTADQPVPALVACVLESGQAAIFPGDAQTCQSIGLHPALL